MNTTLNLWQLAGVIVALMTLAKSVLVGWRLTLGRRRYLIIQLRKIAPGVRQDYVEALLGEPTWQSTMACTRVVDPDSEEAKSAEKKDQEVEITVRTWPLSRLGYLVTWSENDAVVMYGITTTSWWFRPRLSIPLGRGDVSSGQLHDGVGLMVSFVVGRAPVSAHAV
ncbi:ETEC_3214 domain-containing protein [Streptomyces sp. NPDC058619]|uniref:ETEC_3214 domain-containing protein n=1 Tax=unclassified Streptomyces TaxID=2593676 RepID=UPI00364A33E5